MEQKTIGKKRIPAPVRLTVALLALTVVALVYALRSDSGLMVSLYYAVTEPWHSFMSRLCSHTELSVAELVIAALVVFVIVYIISQVILLIMRKNKWRRVYITFITLLMTASLVWAGFSVLWSPCYYAPGFAAQSGVDDGAISAEELESVTRYFAAAACEYGESVERDAGGRFTADREDILDRAAPVYEGLESDWPFLAGEALRPKGIVFSKVMSMINFTGFFFPFTGEANLNMASPVCLLAATTQHELSHQRGIAAEQECNFIAVLSCMESGDADFAYSGALLAYIYLGNALCKADREAWSDVYSTLSEGVRADLAYNSEYWEQYRDTAAQKASDAVYGAFLVDNGQTLGLQSYGACVNLLVHYYAEVA